VLKGCAGEITQPSGHFLLRGRKDPEAFARIKDFSQPSSLGFLPPWFGSPTPAQLQLQIYVFSFPQP